LGFVMCSELATACNGVLAAWMLVSKIRLNEFEIWVGVTEGLK